MPVPSQVGCSHRLGCQVQGPSPWSVDKVKQTCVVLCVV